MAAIFITATGTDIGKTYLACALIRDLRSRGAIVDAIKPVVTGFDASLPEASDPGVLLKALGRPITAEDIARMSPWRFAAPLAPNLAARREGRTLDFDALVDFSRRAVDNHRGTLLIEGIGGIMVPLDRRHTVLDWMKALRLPLLLLAGSYLGSISHTLTCLDVLRRRELAVRALIVNETAGAAVSVADTVDCIAQFADGIPVLGVRRGERAGESSTYTKIISLLQ